MPRPTATFESLSSTMLSIGTLAERTFNAGKPFHLELKTYSLQEALRFRDSLYGARLFLRRQVRSEYYPQYRDAHTGLERLSLHRIDKARCIASLDSLGYYPIKLQFTTAITESANITSQLIALGCEPFVKHVDLTIPDASTFHTQPTHSADALGRAPSPHSASPAIHLPSQAPEPDSLHFSDASFPLSDCGNAITRETLTKLAHPPMDSALQSSCIRRALRDSTLSDELRSYLEVWSADLSSL